LTKAACLLACSSGFPAPRAHFSAFAKSPLSRRYRRIDGSRLSPLAAMICAKADSSSSVHPLPVFELIQITATTSLSLDSFVCRRHLLLSLSIEQADHSGRNEQPRIEAMAKGTFDQHAPPAFEFSHVAVSRKESDVNYRVPTFGAIDRQIEIQKFAAVGERAQFSRYSFGLHEVPAWRLWREA
jgi:hypothetical protein